MYCRFVDISGIVDHHCLSFLFIYCMVKRQHTTPPSTQINHSCVCWYYNAPLYTNQPLLCVLVLQCTPSMAPGSLYSIYGGI